MSSPDQIVVHPAQPLTEGYALLRGAILPDVPASVPGFATIALKPGRLAASIVELELDSCENDYGTNPCTATLALTNIILESQTLSVGATWIPVNATVSANTVLEPLTNTLVGDRLLPDDFVTTEVKELRQTINGTLLDILNPFSGSIYARAAGVNLARLFIRTNAIDGAFVDVDLRNGMIVDRGDLGAGAPFVTARVTQPPGNFITGWWRIELEFTLASLTTPEFKVALLNDAGVSSFIGTSGEGVDFFAGQMRPGQFVGKYEPTTTVIINGMGIVDDLCFNTFGTCQDTPNYIKETKTYRFIDTIDMPIDISDAYPCVLSVKYTPTRLQPGGDISLRGKVAVQMQDFTHDDTGGPKAATLNQVDKYSRLRTYEPESRGTFFGKLKARNEFYVGRKMTVREGYLDDPFSLGNFRSRQYIIEEIRGPGATGLVDVIGRDIISLAIDDRAKAPIPSDGTVAVALTIGATSLTVSAGDGVDYDVDIHIRIDDEIILITNRVTDVLTILRGQGGTIAATHSVGASIQSCLTYEDEPLVDVVQNLLVDFASVPLTFIPLADWQVEATQSFAGYLMETIISEPTGVTTLLKEIAEITLLDLWYSDVDQQIKLKLETPFTAVALSINDDDHIVQGSLRTRDVQNKRLSRVLIYYGIRNFAKDLKETSNFSLVNFEIEADKEGVNKYNDERIRVIFSRWFDSSNSVQVALTSQRLLERFGRVPKEITFDIDAKDVTLFDTGDVIDLKSRIIQDFTGLDKTDRFQIIETQPRFPSSIYTYKALAFFVDPATTGPFTIVANETDFDLFIELGGPPGPIEIVVTINAGVVIDSTQGSPAFTTGNLHPSSVITIINNGEIRGHSGDGGNGGGATANCTFEGELPPPNLVYGFFRQPGFQGSAGGIALNITIDAIIVDNLNGDIFGGGGGGGGGGSAANTTQVIGGGGGGGGRGGAGVNGRGLGGNATAFIEFACPLITEFDGNAGVDGSPAGLGAGGAPGTGTIGDGGAGGAYGAPGIAGEGFGSAGGGGGAGGNAVKLNGGFITWLGGFNPTQVVGPVG